MNWLDRLNQGPRSMPLGEATVELIHWAYSPHITDNLPHRHTYYEICLVGGYGQGVFTVQGQPHVIRPGDIFFARPGVIHQIQNTGRRLMELFWVSFSWSARQQGQDELSVLLDAFASSPVLVVPDEAQQLTTLWQSLRAVSGSSPRVGQDTQIVTLITALLLSITQAGAGSHAEQKPIAAIGVDNGDFLSRLAVKYIHDNLDRRLTVQEIAGYVHLSTRHLTRLLTDFTGISPAAYITRVRMDRAKVLLAGNDMPIKAIAQQVGYPDVQQFTRAFQRSHSTSPGAFRRGKKPPLSPVQKPGDFA